LNPNEFKRQEEEKRKIRNGKKAGGEEKGE
jgi:hypothetical protein